MSRWCSRPGLSLELLKMRLADIREDGEVIESIYLIMHSVLRQWLNAKLPNYCTLNQKGRSRLQLGANTAHNKFHNKFLSLSFAFFFLLALTPSCSKRYYFETIFGLCHRPCIYKLWLDLSHINLSMYKYSHSYRVRRQRT